MTSKPDSVSTLGYHWTAHTGRPLEPQVHWDATGTTLADASTQWCPSGDPVLICIIGTHWKTTGKPLEDHWKHTGIFPVVFQCTLGSKFQAHWIATGLPLEDHWLRVRDMFTSCTVCFWWASLLFESIDCRFNNNEEIIVELYGCFWSKESCKSRIFHNDFMTQTQGDRWILLTNATNGSQFYRRYFKCKSVT